MIDSRMLDEHSALRADIYRLLARLIVAPPDDELLDFLSGLEGEPDGGPLATQWSLLAEAAKSSDRTALERAHFRHLVGVIEGEVVPYGSWYLHGTLMDEFLVHLRSDLRQLGFERRQDTHDPEDHFSALCEVMALLAETRPQEQGQFFQRHLAPWAMACMKDLSAVDTDFYAAVGRLAGAYLDHERERLLVGPQHDAVRMIDLTPG